MSAYESKPDPMQAFNDRLSRIEEALRAAASANGLESAVITGPEGLKAFDPESGSRIQLARAFLQFVTDSAPGAGGSLSSLNGDTTLQAWARSGTLFGETAVQLVGKSDTAPGLAVLRTDGDVSIVSSDPETGEKTGTVSLYASTVTLNADQIRPYGMGTTGGGTPIVMEVVAGAPVMKLSSSAAKFKQDVETYEVDPETVLAIRTVLFRDRSAVEERGDDAPQLVGVIADELDELGLTYFVDYDEAGEVRGARYDRIWIALLSLAKYEHAARVALEAKVADLTARLEALEAK